MCLWLVPRVRSLGGGTLCCKGLPGLTSWWINVNFLIPDVSFLAAKYAGFPLFTLKHRIYFSSVFCVILAIRRGRCGEIPPQSPWLFCLVLPYFTTTKQEETHDWQEFGALPIPPPRHPQCLGILLMECARKPGSTGPFQELMLSCTKHWSSLIMSSQLTLAVSVLFFVFFCLLEQPHTQ